MDIVWRPAPGYEGWYEVSNTGQVRSLERTFTTARGQVRTYKSRILSPRPRSGYPSVQLAVKGIRRDETIHRLVCAAFNGESPWGKPLVLHRNGDKFDNRAENLYWGDYRENQEDAIKHGMHFQVNKTHCAKGHLYTEENTRISRDNGRVCRTCHRDRERNALRQGRRSGRGSDIQGK